MRLKLAFPLASLLLITSCSYGYSIRAQGDAGYLTFTVEDGPSIFSPEPEICELFVHDVAAQAPASLDQWPPPSPYDDAALVWAFRVAHPERGQGCSTFPVTYGRLPNGFHQAVPPKALIRGRIYRVVAMAPGVTGSGSFRLVTSVQNVEDGS